MRNIKSVLTVLLFMLTYVAYGQVQEFHVVSFQVDAFDVTARSDQYKEIDGSGSLYAIIKVTSQTPNDDVSAYQYHFGMMNHKVKNHNGEIWVYVQKNAKTVTISRNGYKTLSKYDLGTTIEEGKTYNLVLSAQAPVVYTQMLMFTVSPADSKAVVTINSTQADGADQMLGVVDASGSVARNLPFGTYTYRIISENYYPTEGRITLNDKSQTYRETVTLRPRFSMITLNVDADAEIFVNGEKKGVGSWTGPLNTGTYQVECRRTNHHPNSQSITVEEGKPAVFSLAAPSPITGTLSVLSNPLGATIKIDGKDYGTTPRNITDLIIGQHTLTLTRQGYNDEQRTVEVKEGQTTEVNLTLSNVPVAKDEQTFSVGNVTFRMKLVGGGTFRMGSTDGGSDEKPVHSVTLSDYYIGETEVTQELWQAVMGSNPSHWKGGKLPVEQVSWDDCQEFITKLNRLTGKTFRLPTEAEWEYAACGGRKSMGYKYSGSNTIDNVAWYKGNSGGKTHEVATREPNELGIYDMSGNVWEWCQDWYGNYSSTAQTNPTGASSGSHRVFRGGGWFFNASASLSANRNRHEPSFFHDALGLRLALQ